MDITKFAVCGFKWLEQYSLVNLLCFVGFKLPGHVSLALASSTSKFMSDIAVIIFRVNIWFMKHN